MLLPTGFRLMGRDWAIRSPNEVLEAKECYGETYGNKQEVLVTTAYGDSRTRLTLLHELLHAISGTILHADDDITESQTKAIAVGLFQLLEDNPAVWAFIGGRDDT